MFFLVAIMVLGSIAGIFINAGTSGDDVENLFDNIPEPVIQSNRFMDLRNADVSTLDFNDETDIFYTFTFDTLTKWPDAENLPNADSPEELLHECQYLGLGLNFLAQNGITGNGVSVAVIDSPILAEHQAFDNNFNYIEPVYEETASHGLSLRGIAIASQIAGKKGVAPESSLHYFAVPGEKKAYDLYVEAIERMLQFNSELPSQCKIRIALIGLEIENVDATEEHPALLEAVERVRKQNIIVIYPGMSALPMTGAGCPPSKDRDQHENYEIWSWNRASQQIASNLKAKSITTWDDAVNVLKQLLVSEKDLDWILAEVIDTFLYIAYIYKDYISFGDWLTMTLGDHENMLAVPIDYITVPNINGVKEYTYHGLGDVAWSTGYITGLAALGLQVKPNAEEHEILNLLWKTAVPFVNGDRLVNPIGFINALGN